MRRRGTTSLVPVLIAAAVALASGCTHPPAAPAGRPECIADFHPGTDYFPHKSTVSDAANFTLSYHGSYQVLTVEQPYPHAGPATYVLVRCGAPNPQLDGELAHAQLITVPVTGLYSTSTTQLGMIAELGRSELITGVANGTAAVDAESVIAGNPGVVIAGGAEDAAYAKLRDAGVPVLADAEWLEPTPLGRAEWIKVIAALTGTEAKADEVYRSVRTGYRDIAARAGSAPVVEVLAGDMFQGGWSMPAGGGYAGRLIRDAGGTYPWAGDHRTGSLQLNLETVYTRVGRAPMWVSTSGWRSLDDVLAADPRYGELAAVRGGQVWSTGPDYWEQGTVRPDLILADLFAILHPDLEPDHRFAFYRRAARG